MKRLRHFASLLGAGVLVAACGGPTSDENTNANDTAATSEAVNGSPDFGAVSLELSGNDGSASDGTLSSPLTGDVEFALGEDTPELLPAVRNTVRAINEIVAHFVRRIEHIVVANPTVATGTTHTWVETSGTLEFQFTMTKVADHKYTFTLGARAASDTNGGYKTILDGENLVGTEAHRGAGYVRCDLTALNGLDSADFKASGELKVVFAHANGLKRLQVKLTGFKKKDSDQPADAAYVYTSKGHGLAGAIKLALHANLNDPTDQTKLAEEWILVRGRWLHQFAARFDAVAFGGDFPAGAWARLRECVAANDDGHDVFKLVVYHPASGAPVVLRTHGDVSACAPGLRDDPPASDLPESQDAATAAAQSDADIDPPADN